jgi:hypothetical protein
MTSIASPSTLSMSTTLRVAALLMLVVLLASACTSVKPVPEVQEVRLVQPSQISGCQFAGITTVSVKADAASLARKGKQVLTELVSLARNEAVKLKGDTIVPATDMKDGEQTFNVYRCQK